MNHPDAQLLIARQIIRERVADAERRRLAHLAHRARTDHCGRPGRSRRWWPATLRLRPRQLAPC